MQKVLDLSFKTSFVKRLYTLEGGVNAFRFKILDRPSVPDGE